MSARLLILVLLGACYDPSLGQPDATTVSFGEAPGADVSGVTRDIWITSSDPLLSGSGNLRAQCDGLTGLTEQRALLRFDLGTIPPDAQMPVAELVVQVSQSTVAGTVEMYALAEAWSEDATWTERVPGTTWSAMGAEPPSRETTVVGSFSPSTTGEHRVSIRPELLQRWNEDAATNHGFVITLACMSGRQGQVIFGFSENGTAAVRPVLEVTYGIP